VSWVEKGFISTVWQTSQLLKVSLNFFARSHSVSTTARLLCNLLRARAAQAVGDQAQLALKELDPREHTAIVADAIFVERDIDLFGQPQWIVAVIFRPEVRVPTWW
jgi:hypothetical protein